MHSPAMNSSSSRVKTLPHGLQGVLMHDRLGLAV
jgi:hypothetical protein